MKQGLSIVAMATEIERQAAAKKDIVASTSVLKVEPVLKTNGETTATLRLRVNGEHDLGINPIAHKQIAAHFGVPGAYYERMRVEAPFLLADNINAWIDRAPEGQRRLIRTMDGNARSFHSDSYRPVENQQLAEAVLPVISEMGLLIVSMELTESRFYLKVVDKRIERDVPTGRKIGDGSHVFFDTLSPAALISNSEVGQGALNVECGTLTKMCTNLAWHMKAIRKTHVGARHPIADGLTALLSDKTMRLTNEALMSQVRDVVMGSFQEAQFTALVGKISGMAAQPITGDLVKVVDLTAKTLGILEGEKTSILRHLAEGGDITRYGLYAAITRTAEDLPDYDRASEFEGMGGKIVELAANEWQRIAEAA